MFEIPTEKNIKLNEKLISSLIIDDKYTIDNLLNLKNKNIYTQISVYYNFNKGILDLVQFINLKILYIYNCDLKLINIPDSLTGIALKQCYDNINIPYKKTIKYIFSLGSMCDIPIDFSFLYHKYKLNNFNYNSIVNIMSSVFMNKQYTDEDLEKYVLEQYNKL